MNRTGHAIYFLNWAQVTASGLLKAQAHLTCRPHPASSWVLRLRTGPRECSAWSQGPGPWDSCYLGRWPGRSTDAGFLSRVTNLGDQSGPGCRHPMCTGCWGLRKRQVLVGYLASTSCSRRCSIVRRRAWNLEGDTAERTHWYQRGQGARNAAKEPRDAGPGDPWLLTG